MLNKFLTTINMSDLFVTFTKSQMYRRKSQNLMKLGFDFDSDTQEDEFLKVQSLLYTEYHIKCESMLSIMAKYQIPSSRTMDILFRLFDVETRTFSEARYLSFNQGRSEINPDVTRTIIYHTTWYGSKVVLRSSYELEYAKYLDKKNIMYFVESLRIKYFDEFKNRYRIAIPDFYIPSTNTIVEIKSSYWFDEHNMQSKEIAYKNSGYNFKMILDKEVVNTTLSE